MKCLALNLIAALSCCVLVGCNPGQRSGPSTAAGKTETAPPSIAALAGNWSGDASIVVDWVQQKQLAIQLKIAADGTVTGKVGDATLAEAKVRLGRGSIERSLGWARDFRIHGKLQGDFIAAEKVQRDEVDIVFDRTGETTLQGGLATSGWEVGPPDKMKISVGKMVLRKSNSATSQASAVDSYRMELVVDPARGRLEGTMQLRYRNVSAEPLPVVRLRLDSNLEARQSMEIVRVEEPGKGPLQWSFKPLAFATWSSDKGALEITLARPLAPSDDTMLVIQFRGAGNHINPDMVMLQDDPYHSLDAWYPKAMTPRDGGWSIDDDRLADYDVTVKLPAEYMVASTGTRLSEPVVADGQGQWSLQAHQIRGFSIFGSSRRQRHTRQAGRVGLAVYLPEEAESYAPKMLDTAADAIAFYEKEYGPYPADHLDIICPGSLSDRAHGGSTACNLIMVFLGGALEQNYRFLIAHEVAHQYFSVRVGSPRDSIGWVPVGLGMMMDEHYAVARGLNANYGRDIMRNYYFRAEQMGFDTTLSQSVQTPLRSPQPWSFGWNMSLAHGKAYAVCAMLRDLLGPEKFQDVIRTLIRERSGRLISEADLVAACEAALGEKLDWFAADWIDGRATFDYAIQSVRASDGGWNVEVARTGTAAFPALVQLMTEDGRTLRQRVDRTRAADTLHFNVAGAVKSVRLDPDGIYPDLNSADNVWPRAQPSPSTRPR